MAVTGTQKPIAVARTVAVCLLNAPWAYVSVGAAAIGFMGIFTFGTVPLPLISGHLTEVMIAGMVFGVYDAARTPDRRIAGVVGFLLNILAFIAWSFVVLVVRGVQ